MSDVYVVTCCEEDMEGCIEKIFKSYKKAESYCKCHKYCKVEEWNFDDDSIYTPFDYVRVAASIDLNGNGCDVQCEYMKGALEDASYNQDSVRAFSWIEPFSKTQYIVIHICKELLKNYSEAEVEYKWTRLVEDLADDIRYAFPDVYRISDTHITDFVKRRLKVLEEKADD